MEIHTLPLKTRLHTDAQRPRDLSCRYAVLMVDHPDLIFADLAVQREATLKRISLCLQFQKRASIAALVPSTQLEY